MPEQAAVEVLEQIVEEPREIVIEAVDFEEAGEARDATIEPFGASAAAPEPAAPSVSLEVSVSSVPEPVAETTQPRAQLPSITEPFGEEDSKTRPYELPNKDGDTDLEVEKTSPGPLRTRHPSG